MQKIFLSILVYVSTVTVTSTCMESQLDKTIINEYAKKQAHLWSNIIQNKQHIVASIEYHIAKERRQRLELLIELLEKR